MTGSSCIEKKARSSEERRAHVQRSEQSKDPAVREAASSLRAASQPQAADRFESKRAEDGFGPKYEAAKEEYAAMLQKHGAPVDAENMNDFENRWRHSSEYSVKGGRGYDDAKPWKEILADADRYTAIRFPEGGKSSVEPTPAQRASREAGYGALNAFAVWRIEPGTLRRLAKHEQVPEATDWTIDRWTSERCLELSAIPWDGYTGEADTPRERFRATEAGDWRIEPGRCAGA